MERKFHEIIKLSMLNLYKCDGILYLIGDGIYSHLKNENIKNKIIGYENENKTTHFSKNEIKLNMSNFNLLKMIFSFKKDFFIFNTVKDGILKEELDKYSLKNDFSRNLIEINGNVNNKQCFKCKKVILKNKMSKTSLNTCIVCGDTLRNNIDTDKFNSILPLTLKQSGLYNSSLTIEKHKEMDLEFVNDKILSEIENNFFNFLSSHKTIGVIEIGIEKNSRLLSKITENMFFTSCNNNYKIDSISSNMKYEDYKVETYLRINSQCTSEVTDFLRKKSLKENSNFDEIEFDIDDYLENLYKNNFNNLRENLEIKQSNPVDLGYQRLIKVLKEVRAREKKDFELSLGSFLYIRNHPINVINIINDMF